MIPSLRKAFNESFTVERYEKFLTDLNSLHPGAIEFRVAETPVFVSKEFGNKLIDACESIVDVIVDTDFKKLTDKAIPKTDYVPNENAHTHMIAFDFGICINDAAELEPQLIEMQGFPTLFGFQVYYPEVIQKHFNIPANFSQYLGTYNRESYLKDLKEVIAGNHPIKNVILLEIKPHEQKTRIDFYCTEDYFGIKPVCITELIKEGKKLYYLNDGKKTEVKRIYNRVIFDDLHAQKDTLGNFVDIREDLDVEWVPHPNWFYRISKYTLPLIKHPYVPATYFLNEIKQIPADLENYVLKPLFSFAGQGVVIDVTPADIDNVKDPENWILQKKVKYADVIETPDVPAKAEIRMMYLWKDGDVRPKPAINLARLSKGKMIGVRYNMNKEWVGGSVCLFEH
ncbi:MAG: hypothetical protein HYR66_18430 [Sphingobacteriales bacterium]|nr:hypothetical protein [Sphingobacteriales bacterium]MBI3720423.1 hypothetical protein [Sphingobacteriales bacterium]